MKEYLKKLSSTSIDCPDIPNDFIEKFETVDDRLEAAVEWTERNCPNRIWTLQEIGEAVGITRERIRQIEFEALKKFRWHYNRMCKEDGIDPVTLFLD